MNRAIRLCFFKKYISIMYTGVVQCVHWPLRPSSNKKWMCSTLNCTFIFYINVVWVFGFVYSWAHTHIQIQHCNVWKHIHCTVYTVVLPVVPTPGTTEQSQKLSFKLYNVQSTHTMNIVWELVVYDHHHTVYNIVRNLTSSSV